MEIINLKEISLYNLKKYLDSQRISDLAKKQIIDRWRFEDKLKENKATKK